MPMLGNAIRAVLLLSMTIAGGPSFGAEIRPSWRNELDGGIRATDLLTSRVVSSAGAFLGQVRDVELADGRIVAIVAEKAGIGLSPGFVFRLPWAHVQRPIRSGTIVGDVAASGSRRFGFAEFKDADLRQKGHAGFRVMDLIGDHARLATGVGYGVVGDIVFSGNGQMVAVLVMRDEPAGGTLAFPYPGRRGQWNPGMSYYGLPFITTKQADGAGIRIGKRESNGGENE
jgi:sporulation protein YlmC with PRC-barrel domain